MRPVLEWLLDNPRRFFASVLGAVLVIVTAGVAATDPGPPERARAALSAATTPSASAQPSAPAPTTSAPTPAPTVTVTPTEAAPDRGALTGVTRAWVSAWLATNRPVGEWRQRMAVHSTGHVTALMRTANPAQVPDATLAGVSVAQASSSYALTRARLAGGRPLDVALVLEPDGWKVAQITSGPPAAR